MYHSAFMSDPMSTETSTARPDSNDSSTAKELVLPQETTEEINQLSGQIKLDKNGTNHGYIIGTQIALIGLAHLANTDQQSLPFDPEKASAVFALEVSTLIDARIQRAKGQETYDEWQKQIHKALDQLSASSYKGVEQQAREVLQIYRASLN